MARGDLAATVVSPTQRQFLLDHSKDNVRARSASVFGNLALARRADVVESYRSALDLPGDADRGRQKFRGVCAACHRLEGFGHEIGKDLSGIRNRGPETILVNVLDPNREIDPAYVNYIAVTNDGRTATGFVSAETATSVTLRRAENATDILLRRDIEQLRGTGLSIMPEGLEKEISPQELADLIAYLMSLE
jgi:putative heme-binding domain-containing protein